MKKKKASLVWTFVNVALSGLGFGLALSASVMLCLRKFESLYAISAFVGLIAGIIFGLLSIVCLLRYKGQLDRYNLMVSSFLSPHKRLLSKETFLTYVERENLGIAVFDYVILTNISNEEKARLCPRLNEFPLQRIEAFYQEKDCYFSFLAPSTLLLAVRKGETKANAEEISKQTLSAIGLDPTLPSLKLLVGIEDDRKLDAQTRLSHALLAASYDSLSRLSGEVLVYEKAMEVASIGEGYDIEGAIAEERLEVGYIPLLNKRNKTAAYFADISLFDPNRGLIQRRELYREGENLGFASRVDSHLVASCFRNVAEWDKELRHKLPLLILPCSKSSFYEASFLFLFKKTAMEAGIDLKRLCLGIPASLLEGDEAYAATIAKKAHAMGIKIAIMDFSARSPLYRLKELSPDIVSFAPDFATLDPRLRDAEIAMLSESAALLEEEHMKNAYVADLYPQKKVTPGVAIEALRLEEEFRL